MTERFSQKYVETVINYLQNSKNAYCDIYSIAEFVKTKHIFSGFTFRDAAILLDQNRKIFVAGRPRHRSYRNPYWALRSRVGIFWGHKPAKGTIVPVAVYRALSDHDKTRARALRAVKRLESLIAGGKTTLNIPNLFGV